MISEALAASSTVAAVTSSFEPTAEIQFLLMLLQGLWGIFLLIIGILVNMVLSAQRRLEKKYDEFKDKIIADYATKKELQERSHGLRDSLGTHSTWIHLIAQHVKISLPHTHTRKEDT